MKEKNKVNDILKFGNIKAVIEYKGEEIVIDLPKELKYYIIGYMKEKSQDKGLAYANPFIVFLDGQVVQLQ